jgi:hypothetical protein
MLNVEQKAESACNDPNLLAATLSYRVSPYFNSSFSIHHSAFIYCLLTTAHLSAAGTPPVDTGHFQTRPDIWKENPWSTSQLPTYSSFIIHHSSFRISSVRLKMLVRVITPRYCRARMLEC